MTTLLLALVVLEGADLIFALDSVPAVFGITRDPFLVYTSNVCAILGLRAFYFLLAGALPFFRYLNAGISAVLIFIGGKMLAEPWLHVPTRVSLAVVGAILGAAMAASLLAARGSETTLPDAPASTAAWIARSGRERCAPSAKRPRANCSARAAPRPSQFCAAGLPTRNFAS